jgi:hypothetical protein
MVRYPSSPVVKPFSVEIVQVLDCPLLRWWTVPLAGGARPKYCGEEVAEAKPDGRRVVVRHTALTAFRRRQELERQVSGRAEPEDLGRSAQANAVNADRDRGWGSVRRDCLRPVSRGCRCLGQPPGWRPVEANMSRPRKSARAWDTSTGRLVSSDRNASSGQVARCPYRARKTPTESSQYSSRESISAYAASWKMSLSGSSGRAEVFRSSSRPPAIRSPSAGISCRRHRPRGQVVGAGLWVHVDGQGAAVRGPGMGAQAQRDQCLADAAFLVADGDDETGGQARLRCGHSAAAFSRCLDRGAVLERDGDRGGEHLMLGPVGSVMDVVDRRGELVGDARVQVSAPVRLGLRW